MGARKYGSMICLEITSVSHQVFLMGKQGTIAEWLVSRELRGFSHIVGCWLWRRGPDMWEGILYWILAICPNFVVEVVVSDTSWELHNSNIVSHCFSSHDLSFCSITVESAGFGEGCRG